MKRNLLLFFITAFSCNICLADIFNIKLYSKPDIDDNVTIRDTRDRSLQVSPSAMYDTDTGCLTVTSPVMMYGAHIKVTDAWGNTVADEYTDITKTGVEILLADGQEDAPYTLEIECGDGGWYGRIG